MSLGTTPASGPAATRAYEFARWAILTAVYRGGEAITEESLAHELGIGREAAREALVRLQTDGLVEGHPEHGALVVELSPAEVLELVEVRGVLEQHAAGRSFANRAGTLPRVGRAQDAMRKSRRECDVAGFTAADQEFHRAIVDAAGNKALSLAYSMLHDRQSLFVSTLMRGRADLMDQLLAEHARIIEALRGDDEQAFRAVAREHLRWSAELTRADR